MRLDYLIMDGDMMIYEDEEFDDDEYELNDAVDGNHLWSLNSTTGTVPIPFMIGNGVSLETRERIVQAVSEYSKKTCIR